MNFITLILASLLCFSLFNAQCLDVAVATTTLNPPTLDTATSTFANDILTIGYNWGTTTSRAVLPTASLGGCSVTPINNGVQVNECFYSQTVSYNFSELTSLCGWARLSTGAVLTYGGPLTLIALESYVDFRGLTQTRNLTYTMEMSVTFPSFATSNTTVEIFSAVLLDVFVTSQIYVTATNKVNDLQTTYFRMVVTSTSVSITNIDIQTIILQASGNFLNVSGGLINIANLYSSGAWQNANVAGALSTAVANNGIQSFNFDVKNNLFAVPLDTSASIVVQVNATVFYLGGKKRSVLANFATAGTQNQLLSASIQVSNTDGSNSGFKTQVSFFLGAVLCLVFLF